MRLRLADGSDAQAIQEIYRPYVEDSAISFEVSPPGADEIARRLAETIPAYPFLVAVDGETVIGYAYGGRHHGRAAYDWAVNVSIYLAAAQHRRGTGRALYDALFKLLRMQGYRRAIAGITLPNAASVGLHEAMGFTRVGVYHRVGWKIGTWHDVGWWELDLAPGDGEPSALLRVDQLDPAAIEGVLGA